MISHSNHPEHPHVLTTTSNLAELVAFTRAVEWAHANRLAGGKPVCIRYDSMYVAHIATGIWKAKKHKPMAQAARQACGRGSNGPKKGEHG